MANGASDILYFGEILEKIRVLNLIIQPVGQENFEKSIQIAVERHGIKITSDTTKTDILFKGFTIQPLSGQTLAIINGNEAHLRLQIISPIKQVISSHGEKLDCHEDLLTSSKEERALNIHCKKCLSLITQKDRTFSRVLDLPSENWQEYLDNWCCHGNDAISKLKHGLNPQLYDCFLGNWYLLIHPRAVNDKNVEIVKEGEKYSVLCKRCLAIVGELGLPYGVSTDASDYDLHKSCSVKLYKYSVSMMLNVGSSTQDIFRDFGEEIYMARKLLTLTRNRLCHKFIVSGTTQKKNGKLSCFALVWIMNTEAKFLMHSHKNKIRKEGKKVQGAEISALKILYTSYLDENFSRIKDEWYGSIQADIVNFPEEICLKLLLMLDRNMKAQPRSMRYTNDQNVSFLKLQ